MILLSRRGQSTRENTCAYWHLRRKRVGLARPRYLGIWPFRAQRAGSGPVVLIDIDPQGSLADWWNERDDELPAFAQTTVARLAADLEQLRQQGFKLAVIDTPPAITMAIQSVISVAELIVVPTRPSPHDLRAVGAHRRSVRACRQAAAFRGQCRDAAGPHHVRGGDRSLAAWHGRTPSPSTTAPTMPRR